MRLKVIAFFASLAMLTLSGAAFASELIIKQSPHDVSTTVDRLEAALKSKGITVVVRVDHAMAAAKVDAALRPTTVLIFGNPKLGTPLMQSDQRIGLDLPLKALAWQDAEGKVWLAYTDPAVLKARYGIADRDKQFEAMTGALAAMTNAAIAAN